jgi:hypothetical protein
MISNFRFLPCLLAFLLSLPATAKSQTKPQTKPQAKLQKQSAQLSSPKLSQLEPLHAFVDTLEKAFGSADLSERIGKTGLGPLLFPATQTAWAQKGLAPDKPLVVQMQPSAFACVGVADSKALASTIDTLPGNAKTTQKGSLSYRAIHTSPEHGFIFFWNSTQLCSRPHLPSQTVAPPLKEWEKALAEASALFTSTAKQTWPMFSLGKDMQLQLQPVSAKQLKLHLNAVDIPWKLKANKEGKTVLASVSADTGVLLKLHGTPASQAFRPKDFINALSPKGDALLPQKQTWVARLPALLADEFLVKMDYPNGRDTERLLLVAKISPGSESAFDLWLAEMPKNDADAANASSLPTRRGPLVLERKGSWAFATTDQKWALAHIEQLEKATPEAAPPLVGLAFPKTLGAVLQGETFVSSAMGLGSKQIRMLMFNAPLRNLINTLGSIKMEARPMPNNTTELLVDIALAP